MRDDTGRLKEGRKEEVSNTNKTGVKSAGKKARLLGGREFEVSASTHSHLGFILPLPCCKYIFFTYNYH
jgi:hypothetical protein